MKTRNKALLLALCAILLVAVSVFGTFAYLTSTTGPVRNTFTVGNVTITLDEAKVDEYGAVVANAPRVTENEYKLIPGHTYTKDPTVYVDKDSEDCFVYMQVTITNFDALKSACENENLLPQDLIDGWNSATWESIGYTEKDGTAVCLFQYAQKVDVPENAAANVNLPALFTAITLPGNVCDLSGLEDVEVLVNACAIQADGFADAADAWEKGLNSTFPTKAD